MKISFPRFRLNVRQIMVAAALVGLNLAGALATAKNYPRRPVSTTRNNLNGWNMYVNFPDGSMAAYDTNALDGLFAALRNPQVLSPPRPSLMRLWAPVIACVAISLFILAGAWHLAQHPPMGVWRQGFVATAVAAAIWLVVPALWIAGDPNDDYHVHTGAGIHFGKSVHVAPFWPRYWRLASGRRWPGDYVCPLPREVSLPVPNEFEP